MRSPLPLLLLAAAAAGATTVEVRFTADFSYAVTSTSSTSCRGGAYRAHALTAAAGLRIDGGGVAAACGASTTCAQVFAAMGYDGWALNAADIASGSLQTFQGNVGSKPVASNYAQSYTSKFADVGGALLLAVAEGGTTTYRQAVDVALAEARDAGVDFGTTPVILCVSGMSSTDITDLGASNAADAVEKLAKETTDVDLVIATGIAGLSTAGFSTLTNWAGDVVFLVAPAASSTVQTMALGFANDGTGAPSSLNRGSQSCSSSNYDEFIYRIINDHVDFVQIGMLCDAGMGGREECDAGRAAFEAINNKNDGIFDDVLTSTKLEVTVATFDGNNCGESLGASARTAWQNDLAAANPVAVVGPGGTTCVKSVASNSNRQTLAGYGLRDDAVVMSESSTATVASDRSTYPNLVRLASTEDTVSQGVLAVVQKYGWQRVAIVYDATDSWAADTARVLSENLGNARIATLGDKCVSRSCTTTESKSDHRGPKKGIRFDKEDAHWVNTLMTMDVADQILDELVALDAKIIYLMITPADTKVIFERIYQTKKCFGIGYAYFTGWASDDIFLEADGSASTDAAYGAQGLLTVKERVDTSGSLGQALIAHREAGLDKETCTGDEYIAGEYCDNDDDATSLAGYGPQVVDAVITLANALDSLSATNRQLPDKIYEAIGDVGRAGFEGYSGTVVLDTYNERVGSMEVRNYQLKEKAITGQRRLAVDLTSIALSDEVVATIVGGQFVPEAGTKVIFPGGTTKVPLDHTPEDDDEARMDTGLAAGLGCGFGALILLMAGVWYHHSKKLNKDLAKVRADLQDFKDSVVGVKVAVRDYVPKAVSTGDAGTAAASAVRGATWYWKETEANITRHDVALVKPPCWVAYPPDIQRQLEQAFESNLPRVQTGPNYSVDLGSMQQVNARSGFKRDVLRDVAAAQKSTRPSEKANTEVRPDELLGEDALLLRKGSMIQIKDQRKDGWAYGTVVLNKGDESKDRRFLEDGISLSAGWFPLGCTDVPSVDQLGELQKLLGGAGDSALDPPKYWGQVKDPLMAEYFPLQQGSEEYQRVYNAINLTTGPQQLRIHSIERVQNISLWQSYCVKKSATVAREKDPVAAERKLFHGCGPDVVDKILQQGFNRSFCGKNATFYGKGVYFARDASYSTYPLYSPADGRGLQTIFAVRVVVGAWSKGVKDALTPDVRDARRNLLYDTTVDNMADPSIFVTYHDAQAYPEYRIRFTQSNPAQGHPQAGQKRPAGYKPNLLEGVEDVKPRAASIDAQPQQQQQQPQRVAPAPVPQPVAQPVAQRQQFMVQIPAGVAPGAVMTVRAPDGRLLQVQVPAGAVPGSTIQVAA